MILSFLGIMLLIGSQRFVVILSFLGIILLVARSMAGMQRLLLSHFGQAEASTRLFKPGMRQFDKWRDW